MKYVLLATVLVLALSTSSEENVLQLLGELKHNAELELEGLELAWQRRIAEKQSVADSLNQSVINQRAECQNKQDDITQKQNDILASENFINWMLGRQKSNAKRIGVLEANICALTNNYVNDIRNYRYALAVVRFLREELVQLEQGASLAQITQFHERISKFVKLYKTGTLVNLMQKIDDQPDLIVPEIEQGTFDEVSLIQRLRPKVMSQLDQQEDDDKADNAVVLIPGCDDSINTVVVVQNDDGTSSSGDVNVKITNGGATSQPAKSKGTGSTGSAKTPQPVTETPVDNDQEDSGDDSGESGDGEDSNGEESGESDGDDGETDGDDGETEGDDGESNGDDGETDGNDGETDGNDGETDGEQGETDGEDGETAGEDGEEPEQIAIDDQHDPHQQPDEEEIKPIIIGPHVDGEEDFTDDWDGFKKLLDAIEKHTRKSLDQSANDEVRSSLGFIDFKLHVELENQHFDKTIQYEQDYLVKQVNQLTGRRQAAILCGARLKQLQVAQQVAQKDIDAAKQFYLEQKQLKQEEVNTFDDVYRIYTTQVKN